MKGFSVTKWASTEQNAVVKLETTFGVILSINIDNINSIVKLVCLQNAAIRENMIKKVIGNGAS